MSKRFLIWMVCAVTVLVAGGWLMLYWMVWMPGYVERYAPLQVGDSVDVPRSLTLIFTGDLMQHVPQVLAATRRDEHIDYTSCFSRLKNYFDRADFVIANLETTLGEPPYTGYPQFRSPKILSDAMYRAGVDVAVVANNHICDRGGVGILTTLQTLEQAGIRYTGAFADTLSDPERHPLMLEKNGFRVALLNYTYGTNGLPVPRGYTVNRIDTVAIKEQVAVSRNNGATHVVLFLHWGNEYEVLPNRDQRLLADLCHRQGVEMVIGSHPHVVQSVETVCDSAGQVVGVTAFSMGNFVSNQRFPGTDGGISVRVTLTRTGSGKTSYYPEYLIHWTAISSDPSSRSGRRYDIVPSYSRSTIPSALHSDFDRFVTRIRNYMARYSHGFQEVIHDY